MQPRQPILHFSKPIKSRQDHREKETVPFHGEAGAEPWWLYAARRHSQLSLIGKKGGCPFFFRPL